MKIRYFVSLACGLLYACGTTGNKADIDDVLEMAGDNRPEIQRVIDHYKNGNDPEALSAAYYLIKQLPAKITRTTAEGNVYRKHFKEIGSLRDPFGWHPQLSLTKIFMDSLYKKYEHAGLIETADVRTISSDILIANIDQALQQWRTSPWGRGYDFDRFCEWILPYKTNFEEPEDWRNQALAYRIENEDDYYKTGDMTRLSYLLVQRDSIRFNPAMSKYPLSLSFGDMQTLRRGTCGQMVGYILKTLRARSIPAAQDMVPAWANHSSMHTWTVIILPDGTHQIAWFDSPNDCIAYKAPKIYRKTDAVNKDDILYKYKDRECLPELFRHFNLVDVTSDYGNELSDVTVDDLRPSRSKLLWLSVFDDFNWQPAAYGEVKGRKATVRDVGRGFPYGDYPIRAVDQGKGIVYLPTYYIDNRLAVAAKPFVLQEDGKQRTLEADTIMRETIRLIRKYPKETDMVGYEQSLVGCRIEGANKADFSDADILYTISEPQKLPIEHVNIDDGRYYRYVRIVSSQDSANVFIAELRFFSDSTRLSGETMPDKTIPVRNVEALFDNDRLSYYDNLYLTGLDAGLDLGRPQKITAIEYCARTDDNEILPGNEYELLYWNNAWISLGRQESWGYVLHWKDVPSNALLLLKNLTYGVEQRPFTYEDGKQIWW